MKKIFLPALTAIIVFLIFLKIADFGIGLLFIEKYYYLTQPDYNVSTYQILPNTAQDRTAYPVKKGKNCKRILFLGDSFGFGYNLKQGESNLPSKLEKSLNSAKKNNFEVINLSKNGNTPQDYLNAYINIGKKLKPDIVIISFFNGNDLASKEPYLRFPFTFLKSSSETAALLYPNIYKIATLGFKNFIFRFSKYTNIYYGAESMQLIPPGEKVLSLKEMVISGFREGISRQEIIKRVNNYDQALLNSAKFGKENCFVIRSAILHPEVVKDTILLKSPDMQYCWKITENILKKLVKNIKKDNARVILLSIPSPVQVDKKYWDYFQTRRFNLSDDILTTPIINQNLNKFCLDNGIEFVDALPIFKSHPEAEVFFHDVDTHCTETGYNLISETLRSRINSIKQK